jgi:hypothetical protein
VSGIESPEDRPDWNKETPAKDVPVVEKCAKCGAEIKLWHCANTGCPWCAACWATAMEEKERAG